MFCNRCRRDRSEKVFNLSGTICDECWSRLGMDRWQKKRPEDGETPIARAAKLENGALGIVCPHCDHKVKRTFSYFHRAAQTERCPRCMEHYIVKRREAR